MADTILDATTLEKLISAAAAAPSFHNTQPWRWRLDPDTATLEVRAAAGRTLRQSDPSGRALHISVGAALFNLCVALAYFGWQPRVRLLPQLDEEDLLAAVTPAGIPQDSAEQREALYDAVWHRHSSRFPFTEERPPRSVLQELIEAARTEGTTLTFPDRDETARLLELTAEAERRSVTDPARRAESRSWIRQDATDGIPPSVLGPQDARGHVPVRDFSALRPAEHAQPVAFEEEPLIAVLSTADDERADWLRAGEALEHVLLVATEHHVQASLLHQALEWPDLRWALRDPREGRGHVQMLVRLGYGPEGAATPRRPVREVLDTGDG